MQNPDTATRDGSDGTTALPAFPAQERFAQGAQFIGGRYRHGTSAATHTVVDPATGRDVLTYALASTDDVDAAVAAARAAFPGWAGATPGERSDALHRFAAVLADRAEDLARAESLQCGKPLKLTREFDVPGTIDNTAFFAGAARHLAGLSAGEYSGDHTSYVRREPIGVVGSIAPWNYPLQMAAWKVLPAIAAGNTIVLKPAELTPLTSLLFAEAATAAGIPDGVLNVVTGTGREAGEHLVGHPDVAMTSFTGSTAVGRRVAEVATASVKRLHLELGGKAPFVVFDDADLEAAAHGAVAGSLINTGQDCTAATRAYVQRPLYEAFVARTAALMETVRLGDPFAPGTDLGPLVSSAQRDRVAGFVDRARAYARVVTGGEVPRGNSATARTIAPRWSPTRPRTARSSRRRSSARSSWCCPSTPTTTASASPTTPRTDWRRRRGPGTSTGRTGRPARSGPAACGSTTTSRSSARCRTEASGSPASARTCPRTRSRSTPRSSTLCSTTRRLLRRTGTAPSSGTDNRRAAGPAAADPPGRAPRAWSSTSPTTASHRPSWPRCGAASATAGRP